MNRYAAKSAVSAALALAVLAAVPAAAGAATADDWRPGPGQVPPTSGVYVEPAPRYSVTMESFKTIDESGNDSFGSDEPYFIASSVGQLGSSATKRSREFADVDSGESRSFSGTERCVFPVGCGSAEAPSGIGLSVQMWESDSEQFARALAYAKEGFTKAKDIGSAAGAPNWATKASGYMATACGYISEYLKDDLLGTQTFTFDRNYLNSAVPNPGMSRTVVRYFGNSGSSGFGSPGFHSVTFKVTRVS